VGESANEPSASASTIFFYPGSAPAPTPAVPEFTSAAIVPNVPAGRTITRGEVTAARTGQRKLKVLKNSAEIGINTEIRRR
jgi:hypothetical protein